MIDLGHVAHIKRVKIRLYPHAIVFAGKKKEKKKKKKRRENLAEKKKMVGIDAINLTRVRVF